VEERDMSHNAVSFAIEADLWAQPLPMRMSLRTQVDLEDGRIQISDLGERKGA
jgi:type VI secretion system protein ImpF